MRLIFLKEEDSFICQNCGEEFPVPENDDLCPFCYNSNIVHKEPEDEDIELHYVNSFYGKNKSVSYSRRNNYPIPNCKCFVIAMNSCYGSSGWWDGRQCNTDKNKATIFAKREYAGEKIYFSGMNNYCDPAIEEVELIDNEII